MTQESEKDPNMEVKEPKKTNNVMDAASALTALGDGESETGSSSPPSKEEPTSAVSAKEETVSKSEDTATAEAKPQETNEEGKVADEDASAQEADSKRYLPEHKKPDAAPTFPEKLMNMMKFAESQGKGFCIVWLDDGKSFVINDPDKFTRTVVPKFFKQTKFTSFTRKLYRWGFRQVNRGIGPEDPIIFGNEFFQRDGVELMAKMRSTTAASTRKQQEMILPSSSFAGVKRGYEQQMDDSSQKRMMFDQYFQAKQGGFMPNPSFYGGMPSASEPLSLTNALYPSMAMGMGQNMMHMNGNGHNHNKLANHNNGNNNNVSNNGFQGNGAMMNMNQFMPNQSHVVGQQHQQGQGGNNTMPQGSPSMAQYPNQQQQGGQYNSQTSTADIVNAAISALRQAN